VHHKLSLKSQAEVAATLDAICDGLADSEVSRRVKAAVGAETFRLKDPIGDARKQVEDFASGLLATLSDDRLGELVKAARTTIEWASSEKRRREFFDGKEILDRFFKQHVASTGMSKEIFLYECAREASDRSSVKSFVEALFTVISPEGSTPRTDAG